MYLFVFSCFARCFQRIYFYWTIDCWLYDYVHYALYYIELLCVFTLTSAPVGYANGWSGACIERYHIAWLLSKSFPITDINWPKWVLGNFIHEILFSVFEKLKCRFPFLLISSLRRQCARFHKFTKFRVVKVVAQGTTETWERIQIQHCGHIHTTCARNKSAFIYRGLSLSALALIHMQIWKVYHGERIFMKPSFSTGYSHPSRWRVSFSSCFAIIFRFELNESMAAPCM